MSDLARAIELLREAEQLITLHNEKMKGSSVAKGYGSAGVSSTAGFSSDVGASSAAVLLTDGIGGKKKKKKEKFITDTVILKSDAEGIITTINGAPLKITGLSEGEKDEYLFGGAPIKKALGTADEMIEYLSAFGAPTLEDDVDEALEKCAGEASKLIKNKEGVWRRVGGRPVFICKEDGTIHAGPKAFVGKKAATLRDDLRSERKKSKKK